MAVPTQVARQLEGVQQRRIKMSRVWEALTAYFYLAPTLLLLGIFIVLPVFESLWLSFHRSHPALPGQQIYTGLENFVRLFQSSSYRNSLWVTVVFTLGTVPVGLGIAVFLAVLLAEKVRGLGAYRMAVFLPVVISTAIAGVIFAWMFNPVIGYLNYWLSLTGIPGPNWLADARWALPAVMITTIWKDLGFNVIIALAGVQSIDESYYDAAKVDGANALQSFWNVTLPLLSPTLFFLLIINVIQGFQTFGQIHVLTRGGPGEATNVLVYAIYQDAFVFHRRGLGAAQAYLLALMVFALSYFQFRYVGRKVHYQ